MPTYHYKCTKEECNHDFEVKQSIKDNALTECPQCKEQSLAKVPYAPLLHFNGSGWFATSGKY